MMDDVPVDLTFDEIANLARNALLPVGTAGVEMSGSLQIFSTNGRFRFAIDASGRYRRELAGPTKEIVVFDGSAVRQLDDAGIPFEHGLFLRDYYIAEALILSGLWAASGDFEWRTIGRIPGTDHLNLELQLRESHLTSNLTVRIADGCPVAWRVRNWKGAAGIDFHEFGKQNGKLFPKRFRVLSPAGLEYEAAIDEIRSVVSISFDLQREDPMMQTSVSGKAPMIASESGHLFIKPRVNGSEPGWFAFDTGAAVTIISRELAATAAPAVVGTRNLAGAGAKVLIGNLRRMARFEVGPLIIENLLCMEAPDAGILLQFAALLDEAVVGIVGWDVLIRTIAELDFAQSTLILHDPSSYQLEGGVWQRLALHHKHPFLRGRLEGDHEGWFCIDSGAGKIPLMIHSSAVQRWDLLRGRETEDAMAAGVGGAVRFRIGTLKWVEVADQRFEQPVVLFAEQESGALSDDYTDGTLGSAFFENRILILDYAGSRFALLPKSPD